MGEKSQRWRDRASHLRATAETEKNVAEKAKLLDLAVQWEELANEQEALENRQRLTGQAFAALPKRSDPKRKPPV